MAGLLLSSCVVLWILPAIASSASCPDGVCNQPDAEKGQSLLQASKTTWATTCEIKKDWIIINGLKYSRRNAHSAMLGSIGKTDGMWTLHVPILINFQHHAPKEWLDGTVTELPEVTITSDQAMQLSMNIGGGGTAGPGKISGSAGLNINRSHSASFKLRGLTISETWSIKNYFNDDANENFAQNYQDMFDGAKKPRIVSTVWILVEQLADEKGHRCVGGHLKVAYNATAGYNVNGGISGSGCTRSSWSFSDGAIMAYNAGYVRFTGRGSNKRAKSFEVDSRYTR